MNIERAISSIQIALSRRRISRTLVVALFASILQMWSSFLQPASATGTPVVTMPANGWVTAQNATTTLSGVSVSGLGAADTYLITVSLNGTYTGSTLKIATTTNLTASYGYTSATFNSFTKVSFTGVAADINNALATLQYIAGTGQASGTTPSVSISAVENLSGLAFNSFNNHYYRAYSYGSAGMIVGTNITDKKQSTALAWAATQTFAGQAGYLVTITSTDENTFVSNTIPGAANIWIGARDNWSGSQSGTTYTFGEGYWGWASTNSPEFGAGFSRDGTSGAVTVDGNGRFVSSGNRAGLTSSYSSVNTAVTSSGAGGASSNGYSNWCSGEPNNADGGNQGEHVGVTNWNNGTCWNDLADANNSSTSGFVVEFGSNSADGGFTNAVTSFAKVYVAPSLTLNGGNNQIAQVGTSLANPQSVIFKDSMGTAIPGASIGWSAARGSVGSASTSTNSSGIASLSIWTMPASVGYDTLTASYSGAGNPSITLRATATAVPASNIDTDSALSLNGSSQYAVASGSTILPTSPTAAFTLEAWLYPTAVGVNGAIFSQGAGSNLFYIKRSAGKLIWSRGGWNSGAEQDCGFFPTNDWTHIALAWDGSTSAKCYVNGALTLTTTVSSPVNTLTTPAAIGQYSSNLGESTSFFPGQIDEIKIWDSARSATNIGIDLLTHTDSATSGLLAYYDFNEGAGTGLYNLVRSGTSASAPVDFATVGIPTWDSSLIRTISTATAYTTYIFKRNFLIAAGGWTVPAGVSRVQTLLVAGGGGGGGGYQGGGGGAGGFIETVTTVTSGTKYSITVGAGGLGYISGAAVASATQPTNGRDSIAFGFNAIGGGYGGSERVSPNDHYAASVGGSGGGATWGGNIAITNNSNQRTGRVGTTGQGNKGGDNVNVCCYAAGGGGAGAVGSSTTASSAGAGGAGLLSAITGTYLAGGGGGGDRSTPANSASGGIGGGGNAARSNTALPDQTNGPKSGASNTGGGGGGGVLTSANTDGAGGNGGSGVIAIRWITASKPIFTQPTSDTTTAGLIDTITVSADPISPLTRTYLWQSSSDTGTTWSNISTGSGFTSQTYSTPILETTTSGIRYQYRVIVTDSDTAGLSIVDTSSAVYITINPRIGISGSYTTQKYGATHVDTFTAVSGTGTGNKTFTFTPNNRAGITWNGATANQATLTIARTLAPGTYYETMTAIDTKGATTQYALAIVVGKADTITVTSLAKTDIYTGSALSFAPSYTITGLQNSDTVTSISWSYSGTENSSSGYGPTATKPINAGSYLITPTAVITNSDSYTAVIYETSTLTVNRATRTITASVSPSPLKFGATGALSSTPSAGSGDGSVTYVTTTTDSCTVSAANLQAIKSSGTCAFSARIARGNNYESATSTSVSVTLSKADTLTVSVNAITPLTYTGSPAAVSPTVTVTGLALSNSVGSTPVTINYVGLGASGSSCALGGPCAVGDIGPGGGKVFYVAATQQSWGRYLEAAPANWSGGADNQASNVTKWCVATPSIDGTIFTALYNGIGVGYTNTYDSRLNVCTGGAIYNARTYRGGGFTNWYVPNSTELALMADSSVRTLIGLVDDPARWGYWGSNEAQDTGYIGSLVTAGWGIGLTVKYEAGKNYMRPIRAFSEGEVAIATYSSPPTDAGTYKVSASALSLSSGSLSDYQGVTYTDGTLLINRAQQQPLVIAQYGATFGVPYKVMIFGGSGTGALTETVTAGTASGCSISGDTVTSTTIGTCLLTATKARSRNYETATATATLYFLVYAINQPDVATSTGSAIALSGSTAITRDTNVAPTISSLSTYSATAGSTQILINGAGFNLADIASITVKFWRNVLASGFTINAGNSQITVTVPAGATTGKVTVTTPNGIAVSELPITITP